MNTRAPSPAIDLEQEIHRLYGTMDRQGELPPYVEWKHEEEKRKGAVRRPFILDARGDARRKLDFDECMDVVG